jgi:FkbM family methyltransferase
MTILKTILHNLPIKLANSLVAHLILKSKIKLVDKYYKDVVLRGSNTIKMDLNKFDIGHQYLAFTGVYENDVTEKILKIKNGNSGLMVDVGANYGYYSLLWASENENNKVICFEASPRNIHALENNIKNNNLTQNVIIEKLAVSDQTCKVNFDLGPKDQTGWGGISATNNGETTIEIDAISLDEYFKDKTEQIKILKIDTEGADYLVIKGAATLIKEKRISHICWEENVGRAKQIGLQGGEAKIFLIEKGYHVEQVGSNEFHAFVKQ